MRRTHLLTSVAGIDHFMIEDENGTSFQAVGATDPIIERNKAMRNHNDGYSPTRELRRVAHIPEIIIQKWKNEEGLDVFNPDHADRLAKKLNDSDWAYLRTADGHIGVRNGVIY